MRIALWKTLRLALFILGTCIATGCDRDALDRVKGKIDSGRSDQLRASAAEEFAKLSTFEYRVIELPRASGAIEVEAALVLAGRERWECYDHLENEAKLLLLCKRRPETYLRYIPRVFP